MSPGIGGAVPCRTDNGVTLGVLKAQRSTLDGEYLSSIARATGLDELLARALADAGQTESAYGA